MREVAIGIDIGGTNTAIGVVDRIGTCLKEASIPTQEQSKVENYVRIIHERIEELVDALGDDIDVKGIGIGAPNGNYYNGTIEYAANLKWKGIVKIVDLFKTYYDVPIALTNDANAAAIGEMMYGAAKGMKNFLVITLGTGLGSGIVANGKLIYGHDGFAGEMGHTIVVPGGRKCGCGLKGCLETYVSATGITRTVSEILANSNEPSPLRKISFSEITSKLIYDAAMEGDKIALEAFNVTGEMLGKKLAESVAYLSPRAIFLFGGLAKAGDLIFKPVKKHMEKNLMNMYKNKVKVLPSAFMDENVAILGASALAWKELENY